MKTISAGALRHRVELQSPIETADTGGSATTTWQTIATVWASVVPTRGTETIIADGEVGRTFYDVTIRHRSDIGTDHRIAHDNRHLQVLPAFDPDGTRRWLVCRCRHETV